MSSFITMIVSSVLALFVIGCITVAGCCCYILMNSPKIDSIKDYENRQQEQYLAEVYKKRQAKKVC